MYRRGREGSRDSGRSSVDTSLKSVGYRETDLDDEEYELYRYNIPPRYDGNRFIRRQIESSGRNAEERLDNMQSELLSPGETDSNESGDNELYIETERYCMDSSSPECGILTDKSPGASDEVCSDDITQGEKDDEKSVSSSEDTPNEHKCCSGLLSQLVSKISSDELLIIALMLAVAEGGGDGSGDTLLLLALLLISR